MKGNQQVIAQLNEALKAELTAICQYILHSEMCHNWGYHALGSYIKKQAIDEMIRNIVACNSARRVMSSWVRRHLISGLRPSVPVPEQGASIKIRSNFAPKGSGCAASSRTTES